MLCIFHSLTYIIVESNSDAHGDPSIQSNESANFLRRARLGYFVGSLIPFRRDKHPFARWDYLLQDHETKIEWVDFVLHDANIRNGATTTEIDKLNEMKKYFVYYRDSSPSSTQFFIDQAPGKEISTLLNGTDLSLVSFLRKREIHYESDLTTLSNVYWKTSYKSEMSISQIASMRSVSNIRSRFNHCDTYSSGFASGPLGIFANLIVTKLNYFFEDELKHKDIWKIEEAKPHNKISIM